VSYPRFEKYKESGIAYIKEIPFNWKIIKLKYLTDMKSGNSITSEDIFEEGKYSVFGGNGIRGFTSDFTHDGNFILIGRQGALCGNINYAKGKFWASEHAVVVNLLIETEIKWLGELLRSMNLNQYSQASAQPGLSVENIQNLYIPFPKLLEQKAIANFLDKETEKIDTLIAEKEKLLKLINEKRAVLIAKVVFQGLNPDVEMKDSGIEHVGKIPKKWQIVQIKRVIKTSDYGISENLDIQGKYGVLRMGDIENGKVKLSYLKFVDELENENLLLENKDLLFNRTNSLSLVGKVGIFEGNKTDKITFASYLVRLRCNKLAIPEYLAFLLNSKNIIVKAQSLALPAIGQANLNPFRYQHIHIPLPTISEQKKIVEFLDKQLTHWEILETELNKSLELLKERRSALITAVVTGKIKVTDLLRSHEVVEVI
jgi:type I restriction enzyme S subunit